MGDKVRMDNNIDRLKCIECHVKYNCVCPNCVAFYIHVSYPRCIDIILDGGCQNPESDRSNCTVYKKIDWISKIKYGKKLRETEKIRDKIIWMVVDYVILVSILLVTILVNLFIWECFKSNINRYKEDWVKVIKYG